MTLSQTLLGHSFIDATRILTALAWRNLRNWRNFEEILSTFVNSTQSLLRYTFLDLVWCKDQFYVTYFLFLNELTEVFELEVYYFLKFTSKLYLISVEFCQIAHFKVIKKQLLILWTTLQIRVKYLRYLQLLKVIKHLYSHI